MVPPVTSDQNSPEDQCRFVVGSGDSAPAAATNRESSADLERLHAMLGHYARQLWDVQKMRIMASNRIGAAERDGLSGEWSAGLKSTYEALSDVEHAVDLHLARLARTHPLAGWVKDAPGIGLPGFARLMGVTGSLDRFPTVSKLWAYLGMAVVDGAAPRMRKGERANWSPQGRVVCYQLSDAIVKLGRGVYREAYDAKKAEYGEREDWTQLRRHNAAKRYAVKLLLKDVWVAWRDIVRGEVDA